MDAASDPNAPQREFWNGLPAERWVEEAAGLDALLGPVLTRMLEVAALAEGERVLDIGCGGGVSSLAAARRVGARGAVLGLDISRPLLALARERAAAEEPSIRAILAFGEADVQLHVFEEGTFDVAISRFGVMFFAEPIAAFAQLKRALREGGRIAFAAWGPQSGNPWFTVPRRAAEARLGEVEPPAPHAPGPFGLSDAEYAEEALRAAGFAEVEVRAEPIVLTHPGPLEEVARFAVSLGPASRILREREGSDADRAAIEASVAQEFAPLMGADGFAVHALIHMLTGRRAGAG